MLVWWPCFGWVKTLVLFIAVYGQRFTQFHPTTVQSTKGYTHINFCYITFYISVYSVLCFCYYILHSAVEIYCSNILCANMLINTVHYSPSGFNDLMQTAALASVEDVILPMLSEENEVTLIVKCDGTSTVKLWVVGKERRKYSCERAAKSCVKVVQNYFWDVSCHLSTPLE